MPDDARQGRVARLLIAPERNAALLDRDSVVAVSGRGLVGDRYYYGTGTFSGRTPIAPGARELSLISASAVAECARRLGQAVDTAALRRNIVTDGIDLRACIGEELLLGAVRIRIIGTCPPCALLARLTGLEVRAGLRGIGGVRAAILAGATLHVGDRIEPAAGGQ